MSFTKQSEMNIVLMWTMNEDCSREVFSSSLLVHFCYTPCHASYNKEGAIKSLAFDSTLFKYIIDVVQKVTK